MKDFEEQLLEYRAQLSEIESQMQASYDKAVMTLSGGALGVSLAFIKDVVNKSAINSTGWLLAAWMAWGLSVTCVLFSFLTSAMAMREAIKQTDAKLIYLQERGGPLNTVTAILNPLAGALFFLGVLAISTFVWRNVV